MATTLRRREISRLEATCIDDNTAEQQGQVQYEVLGFRVADAEGAEDLRREGVDREVEQYLRAVEDDAEPRLDGLPAGEQFAVAGAAAGVADAACVASGLTSCLRYLRRIAAASS
ncbi:hypothetical protein AB0M68_20430 [Streptomyces sp. NPDC051453]|uniref:hypothetical protein n=1 Tax=Streptomyces sp. NPDC051453 TaxID=3154941 RepID=UPI003420CCB6